MTQEKIYDALVQCCESNGYPLEPEVVDDLARAALAASEASEQPTIPKGVVEALRFYANGEHFSIADDHHQFDTVSGEPQNWLFSEKENDCTMIEDGGVAKAALRGIACNFEEPPAPVEGEAFAVVCAAPRPAAPNPSDKQEADEIKQLYQEGHHDGYSEGYDAALKQIEADDDIEECREVLLSLMQNIQQDGHYSVEATCTFIQSTLNCLPIAKDSK